ncbi:hypothetical protein NDN08_004999 [Rhodosorus marinus]|uniref:Uncharacterized protein n=1 Tax=Rhodosorus marinus TaxID=101924 RepID=A0AAV8UFD2_9RHOD|nr:hypothetical protein NDN08_004999 [Rhodosorus marinus]
MEGGAELSEVELDCVKDGTGDGEDSGCEEAAEASGEFRYEEHELVEDAEGLLRESHALLRKEKVQLRVVKHQPKIDVLAELEILKQRRQKRQAGKNFAHRRELEVVASFVGQPKISWDADYKVRLTQSSTGDENKATLASQTEIFWSQGQAEVGQAESQSQVVTQSQVEQFQGSQREGGTQVSVPVIAVPDTQLSSQCSALNPERVDRVPMNDQESDEEHLVVLPPQKLPGAIQERNQLRRELLGEAERKKLLRRYQGGYNEHRLEMNNDDPSPAQDSERQEVGAEQEEKPAADYLVDSSSEGEAASVERTYGTQNIAKSGEICAAVEESPFIDNEADDEDEDELPVVARNDEDAEESVACGESVLEQLIDDSVVDTEQLHDHRLLDKKREEEVRCEAVRNAGICSLLRQNRTRRDDRSGSKENPPATDTERSVLSSERDGNGSKPDLHESEQGEADRRKRARALWKANMDRKSSFSHESLSQCAFADETSRSSVQDNLKARFATKRSKPNPKRDFISPRKMRRQAVSLNDWCSRKPDINKAKDREGDPPSSKSVPFGFFSRPQSTSSSKTS